MTLEYSNPLAGSSFLRYPLEGHPFTVDPKDDYRCLLCHRPRALHRDTQYEEEEIREREVASHHRKKRLGHHKLETARRR